MDKADTPNLANALDFWLGNWRTLFDDGKEGVNRIEKDFNNKVIVERFDAQEALSFSGTSVSVYSPARQLWRQTWVDDEGNYWAFEGGPSGDNFVFQCDDVHDGMPIKLRMIFSDISEDAFLWRWQRSDDFGVTWATRWQIRYQRLS